MAALTAAEALPGDRDRFRAELIDAAVNGLLDAQPKASARGVPSRRAAFALCVALVVAAVLALSAPQTMLFATVGAGALYFIATMLFRCALAAAGLFAPRRPSSPPISDGALPVVTILLPVVDEADGLPLLSCAIDALDYPREKLDVKLLLEEADDATINEAARLGLFEKWDCVIVPAAGPRTKPKACNYGLHLAAGDLVVIYDAEDEPEPDQLRKAAAAFAAADARLACVQARLNYYNADENLLTRLFALEYALWFDLFLPSLDRLGIPIPLGGTSNFFRTRLLRDLGGWDPFNVTEDADLGLRLARRGYRTAILDSTTFEEANCRLSGWIRQRSRWMKGHMQTWLVHLREPREFVAATGLPGLLALHLFFAGNFFGALLNVALWIVSLALLAAETALPDALAALSIIALIFGNASFMALAAVAPIRRGWGALAPFALLTPLYWQLSSVAVVRALIQLATRPSHWEKTQHVVSVAAKARRNEALAA